MRLRSVKQRLRGPPASCGPTGDVLSQALVRQEAGIASAARLRRRRPTQPSQPASRCGPRPTRPSGATAPSSSPTPIWARAAARPRRWPDFLAHNECDTLFLVGDIVDGWQLKRRWYWTEAQSRVVPEILRKVDSGTRVIFVPGNHDEFARDYCGRAVRRHRSRRRGDS